jgi:hypothetical protein
MRFQICEKLPKIDICTCSLLHPDLEFPIDPFTQHVQYLKAILRTDLASSITSWAFVTTSYYAFTASLFVSHDHVLHLGPFVFLFIRLI